MGSIRLDGNYKYIDYMINQDGNSYIIFFPNRTMLYKVDIKYLHLPIEQKIKKIKNQIYYKIDKFRK